nr:phage tail assembly protein T [Escherichia coli]
MSSTEYADWHRFYSTHYFQDVLLDMHFSGLTYTAEPVSAGKCSTVS